MSGQSVLRVQLEYNAGIHQDIVVRLCYKSERFSEGCRRFFIFLLLRLIFLGMKMRIFVASSAYFHLLMRLIYLVRCRSILVALMIDILGVEG